MTDTEFFYIQIVIYFSRHRTLWLEERIVHQAKFLAMTTAANDLKWYYVFNKFLL